MTPLQLPLALAAALQARRPVMIWGPPGVGKSQIVAQVCKANRLQMLDLRLAQMDPTDLTGLPFNVDGQTVFLPPSMLPTDGKGILFIDEIVQGSPAVQNVASQIIHEKRIGEYKLPPGWDVWAAGNRLSDRAATVRMATNLAGRFWHIELEADLESWLDWANRSGIDDRVISFLRMEPNMLHKFDPKSDEYASAQPRTWEGASDFLKTEPDYTIRDELLRGIVGKGQATSFSAFMALANELTPIPDLVLDPDGAIVPQTAGGLFFMTGALAGHADESNIGAIIRYAERLPTEYCVLVAKDASKRNPALQKTKAFTDFSIKYVGALVT